MTVQDNQEPKKPLAARRALLVGSLLAVTLHAFDEMAVVTILPIVAAELGGRSLYGAVFFGYLLVSLIGLVIGGGQATRQGPAPAFALGLLAFAVGLALAAVAPSMEVLIAGRAIQGLGGGIVSATVLVVINRGFRADERPRVMALNASAWVIPALVAPAAAGAIAELASWRWVFGGMLPLVALAALLGVPAMRGLGGGHSDRRFGEELMDGVRLAAGLAAVLGALARTIGPLELGLIAAGVLLAAGPLCRVMPQGMARLQPGLPTSVATKGLLVFAFFGTETFVPLALIEIHDATPSVAGLTLTGAALAWTAGAHLQARLSERFSAPLLGGIGALCIAAGTLAMLTLLDAGTPLWVAFGAWSLAGLGMGIAYNTVTVSAMAYTPDGEEGSSSTALGMTDALGISLATGLGGAVVAAGDRGSWTTADTLWPIWGVAFLVAGLAAMAAMRLQRGLQVGSEGMSK